MPDFSAQPEAFVSNASLAASVSREVKRGTLRKLASRLYTRNFKDSPEQIVGRNLWPLVAAYLPGALIADRTALEYRPASDGSVFLIADHKRDIVLPGAVLRPRKGPPPLESDRPFIGGLRLASPARAFLENLRPSRARGGVARTLSRREIEERLDEMLRRSGEAVLQRLRDEAAPSRRRLALRMSSNASTRGLAPCWVLVRAPWNLPWPPLAPPARPTIPTVSICSRGCMPSWQAPRR